LARTQEASGNPRYAGAGGLERAGICIDQCDRRVHQLPASQVGQAGEKTADSYIAWCRLQFGRGTMRLSIRWRLTLWNMLIMAVVLLAMGALVYGLLARNLYHRVDRSLETELQELEQDSRLASEPEPRLRHWIYEFKEHENISSVVYDPDGKVFLRTEELAAASVPPFPSIRRGAPQSSNMVLPYIGRERVLASRL